MIFMQWFGDDNVTEQIAGQYLSLCLSDSLQLLGVNTTSGRLQLTPTGHCCRYQEEQTVGKSVWGSFFYPYEESG